MTAIRHTLDVYDTELHLVTTRREWTALRKKLPWIDPDVSDYIGFSTSSGRVPDNGGIAIHHLVFWIDLKNLAHEPTRELVGVIAHEASHGAGHILDSAAHKLKRLTDEPHAYLVAWLTRWLWDHCTERRDSNLRASSARATRPMRRQ